jgi:hypothetical protein
LEPAELPESYGRDTLVLMPREPARCFAYWEVAPATSNRLIASHGETALRRARLTLRIHRPQQEPLEFDVSGPVRSCYFDPECAGQRLGGELVLRFEDDQEASVVRSRPVQMPARQPAEEDPAWPVRGEVYARVRRALGQEWPSNEG